MSRYVSLAAITAALIASISIATSAYTPSPALAADNFCSEAVPTGDVWDGTVLADRQQVECQPTDPALAAEKSRKTTAILPQEMVLPRTTSDVPIYHQ